jgi:hypothetical protein
MRLYNNFEGKNMNMKRNIFLTMLVMILAFGMTVVSCDDGGDDNNNNGNGNGNGDGWINGWPNNTVLTNYGISGLAQPSGATNVKYLISDASASNGGTRTSLAVGFNGTETESNTILTWFNNQNDWNSVGSTGKFGKGTNTNTSGNVYYEVSFDFYNSKLFTIYKTTW